MRKICLIAILSLQFLGEIISQQTPIYSQYILNEFLVNPAVAGIDGMTTINLSGRKQWVGLKYAPETYSASLSTRILKSPFSLKKRKYRKGSQGRVGLGAAFVSDKYGAINHTSFQFTYAYHFFIQNYQLSFGLKLNGTQMKIDNEMIDFRDPDPNVERIIGSATYIPDAGVGVNFSTPNFHIGITASDLLESRINFGDTKLDTTELRNIRNYAVHGFYRTSLSNKNWTLEPSVIIRGNEKGQLSADLSSRFIFQKEYWAGLSIRTSGELIILAGLKWNRTYIGYSFDYGFNQLSYSSYGSHEIMIGIKLGDSIRRYRWLERY